MSAERILFTVDHTSPAPVLLRSPLIPCVNTRGTRIDGARTFQTNRRAVGYGSAANGVPRGPPWYRGECRDSTRCAMVDTLNTSGKNSKNSSKTLTNEFLCARKAEVRFLYRGSCGRRATFTIADIPNTLSTRFSV